MDFLHEYLIETTSKYQVKNKFKIGHSVLKIVYINIKMVVINGGHNDVHKIGQIYFSQFLVFRSRF